MPPSWPEVKGEVLSHGGQLLLAQASVQRGLHERRFIQGSDSSCCGGQMVGVPEHYLATHHALLEDFANATQWPKHLLIQYSWQELEPLHTQAGLYVLFITGEAADARPPTAVPGGSPVGLL